MGRYDLKRQRRSKVFKEITDLFIAPLALKRSKRQSYKNFIKEFFCVSTRIIKEYKVTEGFIMPGLLKLTPQVKLPNRGHKNIKKGARILVRYDKTMPGTVEVEHTCTPGGKPEVFELRDIEWVMIKSNLRKAVD